MLKVEEDSPKTGAHPMEAAVAVMVAMDQEEEIAAVLKEVTAIAGTVLQITAEIVLMTIEEVVVVVPGLVPVINRMTGTMEVREEIAAGTVTQAIAAGEVLKVDMDMMRIWVAVVNRVDKMEMAVANLEDKTMEMAVANRVDKIVETVDAQVEMVRVLLIEEILLVSSVPLPMEEAVLQAKAKEPAAARVGHQPVPNQRARIALAKDGRNQPQDHATGRNQPTSGNIY